MVSLSDIAKEVGLNISVVSRALSPNPDRHAVVRKETRDRIREVAKRLGYVPNRQASFNGKKGSAMIYCFLPDVADRLTADLLFGIVQAAGRENFPLNVFRGNNEEDLQGFLRAINTRSHSGLITFPAFALKENTRAMLEEYYRLRNTILMLNVEINSQSQNAPQEYRNIPQLSIDEYYGGTLAAKHLLECGCRKFYTAWSRFNYKMRIKGFTDTVNAAGYEVGGPLTSTDDFKPLASKRGERVGIYADRDVQALNVLIMMARWGITPGEGRILLVGNDDKQQASLSIPTLTTVRQPSQEEGNRAVAKLINIIYGRKEPNEVIKPTLIVRQSTGNGGEPYEIR